jgi:hypothetical protein
VLADVREAFGDHEVRRRFDGAGQPLVGSGRHLYRHRRARGEVLERRRQPAVGEDRGMDAARQVAQLLQREVGLLPRAADQLHGGRVAVRGALLGHAQVQGERHEPLLSAVVEVALDAPALVVRRGDDPRARALQLRDLRGELRVGV